jgi:hypothetical protein
MERPSSRPLFLLYGWCDSGHRHQAGKRIKVILSAESAGQNSPGRKPWDWSLYIF